MADRDDILDVELRIVGQESLGPLAQLTEQLAKITQYQAGLSGLSSEGRVAAARSVSGGGNAPVQSGTTGTHSEPPKILDREGADYSGGWGRIRRFTDRSADREERETIEHIRGIGIDPRSSSLHRHSSVGGTGYSGSEPPEVDPQIGLRKMKGDLGAFQRGEVPFEYPQFGSLTWQDRAVLLSNLTQKIAQKQIDKRRISVTSAQAAWDTQADNADNLLDMPTGPRPTWEDYEPNMVGTTNLLRTGAATLGIAQGVHADAKAIMARVTGSQDAGIQAGYNKASSINIGPFGITNPLELLGHGSAGKESMRQWWTTQRLRMKGGINGEQAAEIQNSLAALGWTGNQGQGIALDTIAPLVQQGLNPTMTSTMFDKSIRHGNTSIKEFNETMDKLGDSARASRMSLDEFQKGLDAAGDAAKQQGGFYRQGMQSAREFSDSTGLGPQALSRTWGSPLVQGMSMARYGIMPNAMGTMTGNMGIKATYSSLDIAKQATSMFATRSSVDPETGQMISGKSAQYAQMAPLMGMSAEEVRRLDEQRSTITAASRGIGRLDTYSDLYHGRGGKESRDAFIKAEMGRDGTIDETEARRRWESGIRTGADRANIGWDSVRRSMYQTAGASNGGLSEVEKEKIRKIDQSSGEDRQKAARAFFAEQNKFAQPEDPNTIKVKFTGAAEKLLMIDKSNPWEQPKKDSNAGKRPANSHTSSVQGAATNSGAQALIDSMNAKRGADGLPTTSVPAGAVPSGAKGSFGGP